ncbi:phage tail assembly chaperone [Immundisolibacter sp.]
MVYAESEFKLSKKRKDGTTLRDHLLMAYRSSGVLPEELAEAPELPEVARHIWGWFLELNSARSGNGFGISPISYSEIVAWSKLTETVIEPWEVKALRVIDNKYVEVMSA